jgi:hypothetical protein
LLSVLLNKIKTTAIHLNTILNNLYIKDLSKNNVENVSKLINDYKINTTYREPESLLEYMTSFFVRVNVFTGKNNTPFNKKIQLFNLLNKDYYNNNKTTNCFLQVLANAVNGTNFDFIEFIFPKKL